LKLSDSIIGNGDTTSNVTGKQNGAASSIEARKDGVKQEPFNGNSSTNHIQTNVNDNEHMNKPSLQLPTTDFCDNFQKKCNAEDELHESQRLKSTLWNGTKCESFQSRYGYGMILEYMLLQDKKIVQKCLSSFVGNGSTLPVHGVVISIGMKGPIHQIPYCFELHQQRQRLISFVSTLQKMDSTKIHNSNDRKQDLELMLLSLITDDDCLKTNEQFDAEYGHDFNIDKGLLLGGKNNKPKLFPKKFPFKEKKRRKKHVSVGEDISKNIISTALVSTTATSSEIARIVSDQMQALSIAETDMNVRSYSRLTKNSLGAKADRTSGFIKSPSRGNKRLARDLVGFEYSAKQPTQNFNHTPSELSSSVSGKFSYSSDITSVTATSMSAESSVTSSIPTLSGPSRDSSANKKHFRRNKVISAALVNQRSKFQTGFDPFAVEESTARDEKPHDKEEIGNMLSKADAGIMKATISGGAFDKGEFPETNIEGTSPVKTQAVADYVPGSRKLFITLALNEDLSCTYSGNKLTSCAVQGIIQLLMKSDSTAFVPFLCRVFDSEKHVESIEHNEKYANDISLERNSEDEWAYQFIVTLPKSDNYYPILKYMCSKSLIPVPLVSHHYKVHSYQIIFCV
jgi:hypothetical protein